MMALKTITRGEFDQRLDAANERRRQELQAVQEEQAQIDQLLQRYEQVLDELGADLRGENQHEVRLDAIFDRIRSIEEGIRTRRR